MTGLNPGPHVDFVRFPKNEDALIESPGTVEVVNMINSITGWLQIVNSFNEFSLNPENDIEKKYADDFFAEFISTDKDAERMPFDDEKQENIIKLLEFIEERINEYPEKDEEILQISSEAKTLRNNIQRLPKNKALKALSSIGAKIKMKGPDFLKYLFVRAKEETIKFIMKQILEGRAHALTHLLHHGG
jgi:hypothetical protein